MAALKNYHLHPKINIYKERKNYAYLQSARINLSVESDWLAEIMLHVILTARHFEF
jgi:hypothetical protein